ncbi:MAG: hypothetical protein HYW50_02405 [Candidatus Diapherotrites archaeon]|nr:hypothetical protein [Candidatus Diapherotrites archaeon]
MSNAVIGILYLGFFVLVILGGLIIAIYFYFKNMKKEEELEAQMKQKGTKNY